MIKTFQYFRNLAEIYFDLRLPSRSELTLKDIGKIDLYQIRTKHIVHSTQLSERSQCGLVGDGNIFTEHVAVDTGVCMSSDVTNIIQDDVLYWRPPARRTHGLVSWPRAALNNVFVLVEISFLY